MMQPYLMNFDTKQLPNRKADCLVVGSGVAGMVTAWHAANAGLSVLLMTKSAMDDNNTSKAQGGVAAVFGADDAVHLHVADTCIAGAGLCDEDIVRIVVEEGRREVEHLIELGAVFDRDTNGELCLGREGCHCRSRILHAKGDATGAEIMRAMIAAVRKMPNITVLENTYLVDLLTEENTCYGALVLPENQQAEVIRAGAVVLATGGVGRLFEHTTNPEGSSGNGVAVAYRAGAAVMDMEFVQFHPTSLVLDGAPNFLISEAVRGAGGILRNAAGERFMPRYHALADLAPRDIVARAIYSEMKLDGKDFVFLDVNALGEAGMKARFPMITATCQSYGLDIARGMIPVAPAAHYMMGGIQTDGDGESSVRNLFACGEAACTGLHGANRLASNSLLEGLAFGKRIAAIIVSRKTAVCAKKEWFYQEIKEEMPPDADHVHLRRMMNSCLGLIRERADIEAAEKSLTVQLDAWQNKAMKSIDDLNYANMLWTCRLIAMAANMRTESRGGHYRSDYPAQRSEWRQHIIQKR